MMMNLFMFTFGEDNIGIRGFYINEFPLLKLYVYQFEHIFNKTMPKLKEHFDNLEVPNELWIGKWLQTLFTICLPLDLLVRVWDCIFAKGLDFLFNFSLALLKESEKSLLEFDDISDISEYFRNMNPSLAKPEERIYLDVEKLIESALDIKISKSLLNSLRLAYEQMNNLDLSILKVKYDLKTPDSCLKCEKKYSEETNVNHVIFEENVHIKIDLNSKFSVTHNEESKKSTYDNSIHKKNDMENEYSYEINDETNSVCSEFDLFEGAISNNVRAHTFLEHIEEKKEEHYKRRSLTLKVDNINAAVILKHVTQKKK